MNGPFELAITAGAELADALGAAPELAVVLGSGWRTAADALGEPVAEVALGDLTGFHDATALGHEATVVRVDVPRAAGGGRVPIAVFLGRVHLYEGRTPAQVVHSVRAVALAGARTIVLTNAAGSLDPALGVGSAVVVADHLNFTGASPLAGDPPPPPYPGRFVDLTNLWSPELRAELHAAGAAQGIEVREGVYAGLPGPHFETPAEIRAYRALGADVLGFSTVLEAIAARHMGMAVAGLSLVTNLCAGLQPGVDAEEVIAEGHAAAPRLGSLLRAFCGAVPLAPTA